jgi:peptide deformylase
MAARPVLTIGNPVLRKVARRVPRAEFGSRKLTRLVADMVATMRAEGGIGIAAPQVGESLQVAVIEIEPGSTRYRDAVPVARTVVVNPKITVLDRRKQAFWEGCLSIPNLRALVERPRKIRVDYLDLAGERRSIEAQGFLATVFQHELDHLAGVLFLDRVRDTTKIATLEEFQRHWLERSEPAEI